VGDRTVLVAVGVNEEDFGEVLAVETYAGERAEAYQSLLKRTSGWLRRAFASVGASP
jgi:transposase-like protein